ncbi:MAG TPA: tetratricopeptide repeat protein [Chroococcales cyanobacterium]
MRTPILLKLLGLPLAASVALSLIPALAGTAPALCLVTAPADQITARAVKLFNAGRLVDASNMEQTAIDKSPDYWLPHAVQSCMAWRLGKGQVALSESSTALKLAPNNEWTLYNAAVIHHLLGMYAEAAPGYLATLKLNPNNWQAGIGYAEILCLQDKIPDAVRMLDQMAGSDHGSYDWWFQVGGMYFQLKEYKKAEAPLARAVETAPASEKAKTQACFFLAALKAGDLERAASLKDEIIKSGAKESDVYADSADKLIKDPAAGELLIAQAKHNLGKDSQTFYSISKIFLQKARDEKDPAKRDAWLKASEKAIYAAIAKASESTNYRWALIALMDEKGQSKLIPGELAKIVTENKRDRAATVLLGQLRSHTNDIAGQMKSALQGAKAANSPYTLRLMSGKLRVKKLSCSCHVSVFQNLLGTAPGALFAYADTTDSKHPEITVVFDPAQTTLDNLSKLVGNMGDEVEAQGVQPVTSISKMVTDMQRADERGQRPSYAWAFRGGEPHMPPVASDAKSSQNQD